LVAIIFVKALSFALAVATALGQAASGSGATFDGLQLTLHEAKLEFTPQKRLKAGRLAEGANEQRASKIPRPSKRVKVQPPGLLSGG